MHGSSCCIGGLAKHQSEQDTTLRSNFKRKQNQPSGFKHKKRQWSSSLEAMNNKGSSSFSVETQQLSGPTVNQIKSGDENGNGGSYVNHAEMAWHERRKEWIGDQSKNPIRIPREPVISWCTTYDDLLSTNQPFPRPIPLSEMVDFLVDIWHEEGLYD